MPQRYRLHLSDGTILLVDHDGLNTWLVDPKAMVQFEGSDLWLPLREFLAAEREAAFRAAPRRTAKTRAELPLIPPPPRKGEKQPLTPAPPAPESAKSEPAPLTPPPPLLPAFSEDLEQPPIGRPAGVEPVAAPVATPRKPLSRPAARPDDSIQPIPLVPLEEAPLTPAIPLAKEPGADIWPSPRPRAADVFAAEDRSGVVADTYGQEAPVIPLKPLPDEERARVSTWSGSDESRGVALDEGFDDRFEDERAVEGLRHADVVFLRAMAAFGGFLSGVLNSLARYERLQRSRHAAARGASAVPRQAEAPKSAVPARAPAALRRLGELLAAGVTKISEMRKARAADEPQSLGELLASGIPEPARKRKAAQELRIAEELPAADEPRSVAQLPASPTPKPAPRPTVQELQTPEMFPTPHEPRPSPAVSTAPDFPSAPRPAGPPPPITELPVLRLKEIPKAEEEEAGDLYDGECEYPGAHGAGLPRGLWIWTKRLAVVVVLVAGGIWAASTWRTWFGKAGEVGEKALTTIDQQVRSIEPEKERAQALQAGVEQLPHLAPETIRLVLSSSAAVDVLEIFQIASDAARRGGASLTREEGLELATLRDEMLAGLQATEREQIRDYERSSAIGLVSPSEERAALTLVARGARSLLPERRARLQELHGKAIAAGLPQPSPAAAP